MPVVPPRTILYGNPPTAGHQPDKAQLAAYFEQLESLASGGAIKGFADSVAALPASGNTAGDNRIVLAASVDDMGVYVWGGSSWSRVAPLPAVFASDAAAAAALQSAADAAGHRAAVEVIAEAFGGAEGLEALVDEGEAAAAAAEGFRDEAATLASGAAVTAGFYDTIALGRAAVADGATFGVVAGGADGLPRATIYRRDTSSTQTQIVDIVKGSEVALADQIGDARIRHVRALNAALEDRPLALLMFFIGQSLVVPRGPTRFQTGTWSGLKMPVGGSSISEFAFFGTNPEFTTNWADVASHVAAAEPADAQGLIAGFGNTIAGGMFPRVYAVSAGIGSRRIDVLWGAGPRANLDGLVERMCDLARADGYNPVVAFYSAHGEADASASTGEATYYTRAMAYYRMCQLYAAQHMRKPDYVAPVFLTYPLQQAGGVSADPQQDREIKRAIARIANDLPNGFDLGAIYDMPAEADRIHPTGLGYFLRAERVGDAVRRWFGGERNTRAVKITDVTLSGTTAVVTFNREVVRDTNGAGENLNTALAHDGFEWLDDGTGIAITGAVYAGRRVTLTLASAPAGTLEQQLLRIAVQSTSATLTSGIANLSGSLVRAAGAGWASVYDPAFVHHDWATPQSFSAVRAA